MLTFWRWFSVLPLQPWLPHECYISPYTQTISFWMLIYPLHPQISSFSQGNFSQYFFLSICLKNPWRYRVKTTVTWDSLSSFVPSNYSLTQRLLLLKVNFCKCLLFSPSLPFKCMAHFLYHSWFTIWPFLTAQLLYITLCIFQHINLLLPWDSHSEVRSFYL